MPLLQFSSPFHLESVLKVSEAWTKSHSGVTQLTPAGFKPRVNLALHNQGLTHAQLRSLRGQLFWAPHLDAEAVFSGCAIVLLALSNVVDVGLIEVSEIL